MTGARLRTPGRTLVAASLAAWLAACSSTAPRSAPSTGASGAPVEPRSAAARSAPTGSAAPTVGAAPAVPLPTNPRGGYYGDDGPPDNVPPGLEHTPDAVPRLEPLRERANRPYAIFGRPYVPMTQHAPYRERGRASWYGRKFHGQATSIGETYDMFGMSAAHPTLPLPSYVRVTNLRNGRSVVVRVNDRGPFLNNRLIDLSYTAALKLGYVQHGSTDVEVELLQPQQPSFRILQASADGAADPSPAAAPRAMPPAAPAQPPRPAAAADAAPAPASDEPAVQLVVETLPTTAAGVPGPVTPADAPLAVNAPGATGAPDALAPGTAGALGTPSAAAVPSSPQTATATAAATQAAAPARLPAGAAPAAYLQLGAFASRVNAEAARHRAGGLLDAGTPIGIIEDRGMFKLLAGPLPRREVTRLAERIQYATGSRPFAVSR